MAETEPCDWPSCDRPSVFTSVNTPELRVAVTGEPLVGDSFSVCEVHAPEFERQLRQAVNQSIDETQGRLNFLPDDPEWQLAFGDDDGDDD
jgi:hypothetical protein